MVGMELLVGKNNMIQSEWERIANEYKKEIQALWSDIDRACIELEKKMPQSYMRGLNMLERSLDFSRESIRMLSCQEPLESKTVNVVSSKKVKNERKILNVDESRKRREEASFEWLYNKG